MKHKTWSRFSARVAALCALVSLTPLIAAGPKYVDPAQTDDDFAVQGEYLGLVKSDDGVQQDWGLQVVAQGAGQFLIVPYEGGLPGAGWNGQRLPTSSMDRATSQFFLPSAQWTGRLRDASIQLRDSNHQTVGRLTRVMRQSPTLGAPPPQDAVVLFDGSTVDQWKKGRMSPDGLLMQGTTSRRTFGSHRLHIEFRLPYQPQDGGQQRGNSGIYLQGRYEVQMLDSFGLTGEQNECGGVYSIAPPRVNVCLPPLVWQTYDIEFHAARYDPAGELVSHPRMTVRHNGVVIHADLELDHSTTASPRKPGPEPGPVYLQDHGCPVRYRNIWVQPIDHEA